ncbi:MAG: PHP domain-containing protein [Clostridia bacterium]|nr:PHP domain-containing protein [Clostridia bacterium]MBO4883720.1 PHP domain-containing protein [Clostridia bacterium]
MNSTNRDDSVKFDLHIHTTASDGTDSPEAVVELAARNGFSTIAVTDHDTMRGVPEARRAGRRLGVRVIPGVEISAGGAVEVHVLGYGVKDAARMEEALARMCSMRETRMEQMVEKIRALGIDIELDQVTALSAGTVGRSHLARVLVQKGVVRDVREAFVRYLAPGRPAYVAREKLKVEEAVQLIRACGGLAGIAHPGQNHGEAYWGAERFRALKPLGLKCIECYHMAHSAAVAAGFERIARSEDLLVTGGSDYHGQVKAVTLGDGMKLWRNRESDFKRFLEALGENV